MSCITLRVLSQKVSNEVLKTLKESNLYDTFLVPCESKDKILPKCVMNRGSGYWDIEPVTEEHLDFIPQIPVLGKIL